MGESYPPIRTLQIKSCAFRESDIVGNGENDQ